MTLGSQLAAVLPLTSRHNPATSPNSCIAEDWITHWCPRTMHFSSFFFSFIVFWFPGLIVQNHSRLCHFSVCSLYFSFSCMLKSPLITIAGFFSVEVQLGLSTLGSKYDSRELRHIKTASHVCNVIYPRLFHLVPTY